LGGNFMSSEQINGPVATQLSPQPNRRKSDEIGTFGIFPSNPALPQSSASGMKAAYAKLHAKIKTPQLFSPEPLQSVSGNISLTPESQNHEDRLKKIEVAGEKLADALRPK
jgi:hypothetical protein